MRPPRYCGTRQCNLRFQHPDIERESTAEFAEGAGVAAGLPRIAVAARRSAFCLHTRAPPARGQDKATVLVGRSA